MSDNAIASAVVCCLTLERSDIVTNVLTVLPGTSRKKIPPLFFFDCRNGFIIGTALFMKKFRLMFIPKDSQFCDVIIGLSYNHS